MGPLGFTFVGLLLLGSAKKLVEDILPWSIVELHMSSDTAGGLVLTAPLLGNPVLSQGSANIHNWYDI